MMRGAVEHHLVVIGTGIAALTLARNLLLSPLPLSITLLDKASAPGGRLSSRQYDSGTILEPGLRIFESPRIEGSEGLFGKEVDRWAKEGWIREVDSSRRKGVMGDGRWWEGAHGIKYLVSGLMGELLKLGGERLQIHYNVTAANPTPTSLSSPLSLTLNPPTSLAPISLLVHTAPSPQVLALLPVAPPSTTTYIKTLTFLLPTLHLPNAPIYHRHPHSRISSIGTGYNKEGKEIGIVFQSTPEKLGVTYEKEVNNDEDVKAAFWSVITEASLIPSSIIVEGKSLTGRESQIKRWKFAQIDQAAEHPPPGRTVGQKEIIVLEGGNVILAGDGTSGGQGGVEGSFRAGIAAAGEIRRWLEREGKATAVL